MKGKLFSIEQYQEHSLVWQIYSILSEIMVIFSAASQLAANAKKNTRLEYKFNTIQFLHLSFHLKRDELKFSQRMLLGFGA